MTSDALKALELQTHAPRGICARVDSQDLRQLLEERQALLTLAQRMETRLSFFDSLVSLRAVALSVITKVTE